MTEEQRKEAENLVRFLGIDPDELSKKMTQLTIEIINRAGQTTPTETGKILMEKVREIFTPVERDYITLLYVTRNTANIMQRPEIQLAVAAAAAERKKKEGIREPYTGPGTPRDENA